MSEAEGPAWMDDVIAQRVRDDVRAGLGVDPAMPADVATRLRARLAVETAAPAAEPAAPVTTLPVGTRRPLPRPWLAAAAGIVALAVGTTLVLTHHPAHGDRAGTSEAASAPKAPDTAKARQLPTRRITRSGTVITTPAGLDAQARDLVSGAATGAGTADAAGAPAPGAVATSPTRPLVDSVMGGLTTCLASLDDSKTPIAVDEVTYKGRDSLLALFPGEGPKQVDLFVIGPQCGGAPPDGIREFRTVTIS